MKDREDINMFIRNLEEVSAAPLLTTPNFLIKTTKKTQKKKNIVDQKIIQKKRIQAAI